MPKVCDFPKCGRGKSRCLCVDAPMPANPTSVQEAREDETPAEAWARILARPDNEPRVAVRVPPYGNVMATPESETDHAALQVICRVFDDWEPVYERWLAYDKSQWLWAGRALGGFLRGEIDRERAAVRAERDAEIRAMVEGLMPFGPNLKGLLAKDEVLALLSDREGA